MRQLREAKLYKPMKEWFVQQGYEVRAEYPCFNRNYDAIAVKDDIVIAIELKMALTKKLFHQLKYTGFADYCYGVVATRPRKSSQTFKLFIERGFGVISIKNNEVTEIIKPIKINTYYSGRHRHAIEYVKQTKDIGVGGRPQLKGIGPAQNVWKLIIKYRSKYPNASWRELYSNIPNHYCDFHSMQNAMRILQKRRKDKV